MFVESFFLKNKTIPHELTMNYGDSSLKSRKNIQSSPGRMLSLLPSGLTSPRAHGLLRTNVAPETAAGILVMLQIPHTGPRGEPSTQLLASAPALAAPPACLLSGTSHFRQPLPFPVVEFPQAFLSSCVVK